MPTRRATSRTRSVPHCAPRTRHTAAPLAVSFERLTFHRSRIVARFLPRRAPIPYAYRVPWTIEPAWPRHPHNHARFGRETKRDRTLCRTTGTQPGHANGRAPIGRRAKSCHPQTADSERAQRAYYAAQAEHRPTYI